jgi:hypothetical protein
MKLRWICALLITSAALAQEAQAGNYLSCSSSPGGKVTVDGITYQMPDVQDCDIIDDGLGGGDYGGNWGGSGGGGGNGQYCATLLMSKPSGCGQSESIDGHNYGSSSYAVGSGLATAISNTTNPLMASQARIQIQSSLSAHTANLGNLTLPLNTTNQTLIDGVALACEFQRQWDAANPPFSPHSGGASPGLRACLGTVTRLHGEANMSFTSFFQGWLANTGVVLADLGIPQTMINWFAPENSLTVKYEKITAQAQCNVWFSEVRNNGC